jgi:nicotinate-nucleotide adenylyltransferase
MDLQRERSNYHSCKRQEGDENAHNKRDAIKAVRPGYDECMDELPPGARRIAFFGGSFDPPHLGHLAVASAARAAVGLDVVLFAPVGAQPLKPHGATAPFDDRLAMTRFAIAGEPAFAISLADAPTASREPNYTLETLLHLRAELPADGKLFCLMGADSFLSLRHWHRAAEIPFAAPLIVASRPLTSPSRQGLDDLTAALPAGLEMQPAPELASSASEFEIRGYRIRNAAGDSAPLYLLPGLHIEISATEIREQARAESGAGAVAPHRVLPRAVAEYIRSHGLYQ